MLPLGHPVPQFELFDVSFPEKLLKIVATRLLEASLKFTKYRLAAGLRPDPLEELKRSIRGPTSKGKVKGREGRGGRRGKEREDKGEEGKGEGKGADAPHMTCLHDTRSFF